MNDSPKVLYTANTPIHIRNFHLPYLKWFKEKGFETHVAFNGEADIPYADHVWNVPFGRSPLSSSNFTAFRKLKSIFSKHHFNLVHCHTPMGGAITRLAARSCRSKGTKVLYTSHGFHFYKGAPLKNWLVLFPMEWLLGTITDAIITINKEDYQYLFSKKFLCNGKYQINGIGLDPSRLNGNISKKAYYREQLGYDKSTVLILYIAEFIPRKNHEFVINSLPEIIKDFPNVRVVFAGGGVGVHDMKQLAASIDMDSAIDFLGYREDIGKIISIADIGISASKHEGLGLGVAEMMYHGIPVVVSEDRGHRELVAHDFNGFMFPQNSKTEFVKYLKALISDEKLRTAIGKKANESMNKFLVDQSLAKMIHIYQAFID